MISTIACYTFWRITTLVDEEIDGESYLGLTESILANVMKLKAGQIVKILKHVKSLAVSGKCFNVFMCVLFDSHLICKITHEAMPTCFKCHKQLSHLRHLCHHLRHVHLLFEPAPINCAEDGCSRTFSRYNSFYRHISTCHPQSCSDTAKSSPLAESSTNLPTAETGGSNSAAAVANDSSVSCVPSLSEKTIKDHAAHFLMTLTASSSMTVSQVNFIKDSVTELVANTVSLAKHSSSDLLRNLSVSSSDRSAVEHYSFLDRLSSPFDGVESTYKLEKYVSQLTSYVEPKEHILGQRWEGTSSSHEQHLKDDTCMYVSVKETLTHILHWHRTWDEMLAVDDECVNDDDISCYFSGQNFKRIYTRLKNEIKIPFYPVVLQLYYDDFEMCNPIGSKAGVHKLGGFYFTISNLGQKHKGRLDNINLVALVYRQDIVKYGMSAILEPLVKELLVLESGFDVVLEDGSKRQIVCFLGNVVADNLGLHGILGYTESFTHSYACDFCYGTVDDFQTKYVEDKFTLRDRQQYDHHCDTLLKQGSASSHVFGIKSICALSQLKYYHPAENDTCDIMHDILEGVAPYEVNLLLRHVILKQKLLSLEDFNRLLAAFDYGTIVSSSKPSQISLSRLQGSDTLGQHSHQMLVLLYVLPFILSKYVTADNANWKLFILLLEILELVFSPVVTAGHLSYLSELIAEHHTLFRKLYPDCRLKYKHHRMVHYPSVMVRNGPLSEMSVIRYEAKHGFFKRLAHIICNFRNVCKTLARRNQMRQAVVWCQPTSIEPSVQIGTGRETVITMHKEFMSLFADSAVKGHAVYLANSVRVCGTTYEPGRTVIVDADDNGYPVLGYIVKIIVSDGIVSFAMHEWTVSGFCSKTRSYLCLVSQRKICCHQKSLLDFHPVPAYQCSDEECSFYHIRLRHLLCSDN